MKFLITGGTGFVGAALVQELRRCGHKVTLLTRSTGAPDHRRWDPVKGELDSAHVASHDSIIHLAGESILGLWTKARRQRIRDSRVLGTSLLTRTILALPQVQRPRCFISASAIGYYGNR